MPIAQFVELGVRLKAAEPILKRNFTAAIRVQAQPGIARVRQAARDRLPKSGGLAARVAEEPIGVSIRFAPASAGIRVTTKTRDTRSADRGFVRHPVFGHLDRWVGQSVTKGYWTDTWTESRDEFRHGIEAAMVVTANELLRGI